MGKKMGRPTDYKPELVQAVYDYVDECVDTVEEWHKVRGVKSDSYERIMHVKMPSIEGLACHLMFTKDTLYQWEKDPERKEFSDALEHLRQKQAEILLSNSLGGQYNPTIAKLLLSSHGYVEKTENKTEIVAPDLAKTDAERILAAYSAGQKINNSAKDEQTDQQL